MPTMHAYSAPTDLRRLPKLKPPHAPSLVPSPSPSFDPPLFELPQGSPAITPRRLEDKEKILSRSAPTRLRRITPLEMDVEPQSRAEPLHSPMSSETSSNTTPTGSPTIWAILQNRGQQPARQDGRFGFSRKVSSASSGSPSSPQQSSPSPGNRRMGRKADGISSRQKVEFGLTMAPLPEQGRGIKPEKSNIHPMDESDPTEGSKFSSLGDLQFQMDLPVSKKEIEDKRKEPDESLDFLQNLDF